MHKAIRVVIGLILIIILVNIVAYVYLLGFEPQLYRDGVIIEAKPYVLMFNHGNWKYFNVSGVHHFCHFTQVGDESYCTRTLLDYYKSRGYEKAWLSQCHTGMYSFMEFKSTDEFGFNRTEEVQWYDWASRNENPGKTWPFFVGGLIRVSENHGELGFG